MRFKPASLWAVAITIVVFAAVILILGVSRKYRQQYIPIPKQVSEATCKLDPPVLTVKTQSWKRYTNDKLCFSFLYPATSTFDTANAGTPHEFIQVYDTGFDFQVIYPTSASTIISASSPPDVLHQLPDALVREFSGYKNIAGVQWVELTEHDKIADLRRYYAVKNHYMYTLTTENYDSMAVSDTILQSFQFGVDE